MNEDKKLTETAESRLSSEENYSDEFTEPVVIPAEITIKTKKEKVSDLFIGEWKKYTKSQIIALNSLVAALILLFAIFPLSIGALQLAVLQIIAILICTELLGLLNGILSGLFFGFVSFVTHLMRPGLLSPVFISNPMITFFPRIMMPIVVFFTMKLFDLIFSKINYKSEKAKKITPKILDTIKYAVAAFMGVATNTAGVLGFMYAFYGETTLSTGVAITAKYIMAIVSGNSVIEAAVCTALTPAIVIAVKKTLSLTMRKKHAK